MIFVAGITAIDAHGKVPFELEAELRAAFSRVDDVLALMGSALHHVVDVSCFSIGEPARVHPVLRLVIDDVFGDPKPVTTCMFVRALLEPNARCELRVIARASVDDREAVS